MLFPRTPARCRPIPRAVRRWRAERERRRKRAPDQVYASLSRREKESGRQRRRRRGKRLRAESSAGAFQKTDTRSFVLSPFFFERVQGDAGSRVDDEKDEPRAEEGAVGGSSHFVGGHERHVGCQRADAGEEPLGNLNSVAGEHKRDERVTCGPAEAQNGRSGERAA